MSIKSFYHPAARLALIVAITICTCLFVALASQTFPLQDDFCRAAAVPATEFPPQEFPKGLAASVGWTYQHWSGRWASIGLETILLPSVPARYPWLLVFLAVAQAGLLYAALRQLGLRSAAALFYTAVFALVLWSGLPAVQEGVFWITGLIEYQLSLVLALLLFALLLSPDTQNSAARTTRAAIAILLAFLLPAFHELLGGVLVLVLFAASVVVIQRRDARHGMWIAVCVVAVISFLIVFVAPGNAVRASAFPNHARPLLTLRLSLETARDYLLPWFLDLKHWVLAVIICLDPMIAVIRKRLSAISFKTLAALSLALLALILVAIVAASWNVGSTLAGRTMDLIYGIFLAGWIAIAFLLGGSLEGWSLNPTHRRALRSVALVLLAVAAVGSSNNVSVLTDLGSGRVSIWHAHLRERFQTLRSSDRASDVQLQPLPVFPNSLFAHDITPDPAKWSNRCLSTYFDVHSVRTETRADDNRIEERLPRSRGIK